MVMIPDSRMWGSEQQIICPGVPGTPSGQLARVELDRPQTWSFLFTVSIPDVLSTPNVDVRFEVSMGLGRGAPIIALARLRCNTGGGKAFTCSAYTQGLLDPLDDTIKSELITYFPAQVLNCNAIVENAPSGGGSVFAGAFFAPLSHTPWDQSQTAPEYQDHAWGGGGPDEQ